MSDTSWLGGSWSTAAAGCAAASPAQTAPEPAHASAKTSAPQATLLIDGCTWEWDGSLYGYRFGQAAGPVASTGHRSLIQQECWKSLAARRTRRRGFELLDAALHLIQPLIGPLGGLIGGFGALRRALHSRIQLIEP